MAFHGFAYAAALLFRACTCAALLKAIHGALYNFAIMSISEQQSIKQTYHAEAQRYLENARKTLTLTGLEGKNYSDDKYVRTACGTAYVGVLKALDGYLLLKEAPKQKGRRSIEYYRERVGKIDRRLLTDLNNAYTELHLSGYYDGITRISSIQSGFEIAEDIIKRIEP